MTGARRTASEPTGRMRLRAAAASLLAAASIAALGWGVLHRVEVDRLADAGERAFTGRAPLSARIDGHASPLPPEAAACANCHRPAAGPRRADGSAAPPTSLGPALHGAGLIEPAARRGGPPSRFDEASFCRLLRTGEDPAGVLLPRAMPRYEIEDLGCTQLWRHLLRTDR